MALRMLCATRILANSFRNLTISDGIARNVVANDLLKVPLPTIDSIRSVSFLNKLTMAQIWKGATSVSNAGKKRGRGGKAAKGLTKDLNRGQVIGQGRKRLNLPGLNTSTMSENSVMQIERGQDNSEWEADLFKQRDAQRNRKWKKTDSSERGYSGKTMPGKTIGPPEPIGDYTFDGFDTRVIEFKIVNKMHGNLGRFRRHSSFVVTGNGNGMAGFAMGKSTNPKASLHKAKKRAAQNLVHIQVCDGHTVFHDFFCQFGFTKIHVWKKPPGYGLKTHRVIKTICQLLGIKDLHAKIEGATNVQNIVKAFFMGLLQQKTYDQLAEEKKLFVVEFRKDSNFFPRIVGTPSYCRKTEEIPTNEELDFKQYVMNDKVLLRKKKHPPFYAEYLSYKIYLRSAEKRRSHGPIKADLFARYGSYESFLTEKYPEAKSGVGILKKE